VITGSVRATAISGHYALDTLPGWITDGLAIRHIHAIEAVLALNRWHTARASTARCWWRSASASNAPNFAARGTASIRDAAGFGATHRFRAGLAAGSRLATGCCTARDSTTYGCNATNSGRGGHCRPTLPSLAACCTGAADAAVAVASRFLTALFGIPIRAALRAREDETQHSSK
jgi:hypothetical protein